MLGHGSLSELSLASAQLLVASAAGAIGAYYRRLGQVTMQLFVKDEGTAARRRVWLYLVDATDGITPETGEGSGQPQVSKNGGSWANTAATLTAIGNGTYYVELTAGELDTAGQIAVRYKSANTAEFSTVCAVITANVQDSVRLGLTALPNAAAEASGGLITLGTGTGQLTVGDGLAHANVQKIVNDSGSANGLGEAGLSYSENGFINANVAYISEDATAADNLEAALDGTGGVTISAALTGNITGNLSGSVGSVSGAVGSVTGAVGSVTGNVGGNVTGSIGSLATQAKADVNVEADAALADAGVTTTVTGRIDAAISTRLASASYTAPANSDIVAILGYVDTEVAAIKTVTDHLATALELDGAVYRFTVNALEQAPSGEAGSAAAVWDLTDAVDGYTPRQVMRGLASVLLGKASGLAGSAATFRDLQDTKDRVVAAIDSEGNRGTITRDLT